VSINSLLNTSNQALQSFQFAIDLTGGNIANVNTPGYSRQRAAFQTVGSVDASAVRAQLGIEVSGAERIYDAYLNNQVTDQAQLVGYNEGKNDVLDRIEGIFAENSGGGLSDLLNKFWNAWSGLTANPQGQVERENLLAAAESLASKFNGLDSDLAKTVRDVGDNVTNTVAQANNYLSAIVDLNTKIVANSAADNGGANLLKDQQSELLKKLGNLVDINYITDANGAVSIFLANGKPLISVGTTWQLAAAPQGNKTDIVYKDDPAQSLIQPLSQGKKGKLAALLEIQNTVVPEYEEKLNALAAAITTEVNNQHRSGYDNSGNAGGNFFTPTTDARHFQVSTAISADLNKIAAASTVDGDGDNALAIAAIQNKTVMDGGTFSIADSYASFIGQIGRDVAAAKSSLDQQNSIMDQLNNRRESTSGVSLDEEMMNLMKYQMSYSSTGKLVSTINQMMDTLLQLVK